MFKYKEKKRHLFIYNIQSVVHCRKFINIPHCV